MRIIVMCFFSLLIIFADIDNAFAKEDFKAFYNKFFTNKEYQIERVKFPLASIWYDCSDFGNPCRKITEKKYKNDYILFSLKHFDDCIIKINNSNSEKLLTVRGIQSGVSYDFYFEMINDKWYLNKIINKSN